MLAMTLWSSEELRFSCCDQNMNCEKLKQLQNSICIGGKGSASRKKVIHRTATADYRKRHCSLNKLSANNIHDIEEVNMIKDDLSGTTSQQSESTTFSCCQHIRWHWTCGQ